MTQQEDLLRRVYSDSEIADVQYIEAHGTGTPIGDSTEVGSISNVIAKARPPGSGTLWIGSVKSNIGHTESAAGVAGLIKVLLMMRYETIVPSVFYSAETSSVDAKTLHIQIPVKTEKWKSSTARVAGVNNFGFGGTNAHAIVKQHIQLSVKQSIKEQRVKYFVVSANTQKSLKMMFEDTIKQLEAHNQVDLNSLLYTSACRRSHQRHKYRKAIAVSSVDDLKEKLKVAVDKKLSPALSDPRLVFVFCGNGVTYHGMCKQLLKKESVFREKIKEITHLFQTLSSLNILSALESDFESSDFKNPDVVQPLLFAVQVGIFTLLRHWGVHSDAVLGHSVGEVAAAHCSGFLSLEDAVKVIYFRSTLQTKVTGGKMLLISNMASSEVASLLPNYSGRISLAAFNSPSSCTLSGDADAIDCLHKELINSANSQNLFLRLLDVPAAYHSHMMEPILPEIEIKIGSLQENDLDMKLFSTVTGKERQQGDFCSGQYWARNIREPVAFEQALKSATKGRKTTVFVEIGPRRALQRNIIETLGNNTAVVASVEPQKDHESAMSVISKLFELGIQVNWDSFYRAYKTTPLFFPRYQFDCSDRDVIIGAAQNNKPSSHPVICQTGGQSNIFSCNLTSDATLYLKEHKHNNTPIIPGAFYAELGLAAFLASAKPKVALRSVQLSVNFHSPFVLKQNSNEMKVQLEQKEKETAFTVFSSSGVYASGTVVSRKRLMEEQLISLSSIYKRCNSVIGFEEFYGFLSQGGFQYGDVFQNKTDVHYGEDLKEALAAVSVPDELQSHLHDYYIHPVVLDFLMQLLPVTVEHIFAARPGFPAKIGSLIVFESLQNEMIIYLRATDVGTDHFEVCGCFADKEGRVLVEVKHVTVKYLGSHSHVVEEYFYHNDFSVVPKHFPSSPPPKALVFSNDLGISKALQHYLDPISKHVSFTNANIISSNGFPFLLANLNITAIKENFDEVLFLWSKEDLTSQEADVILHNLASCCEVFRQIVLELKRIQFAKAIRAITYQSSDITVDHISPGFVLAGMTRSLAAELPDLSFQLIDISAISAQDIKALSEVLRSHSYSEFPELVVKNGLIFKPSIVRTPQKVSETKEVSYNCPTSELCLFQTADAHKMSQLSAIPFDREVDPISHSCVEIQLSKICVHSSDYFPVSASHFSFGQTLYWNKYSTQKHKLLALDFSGVVTAVGKNVQKLKVGDQVAACYPVVAAAKVQVPEDVCYRTKMFPFLQKTPCVSYFVLIWEILHETLHTPKQNLGIICTDQNSALVKILALCAYKSGWNVIVGTQCNGSFVDASQVDEFVILPPFEKSVVIKSFKFPGVRHAVFICESQMQSGLVEELFQNIKESVCVQTIQMQVILQKGYLKARRPHIYNWLKSLKLNRKFAFESFTFQSLKSESKILDLEKSPSYFSSKKVPVIALEKDSSGNLSNIPLLREKKQLFRKKAVYIVTGGLTGLGFETVKFISQRGGGYVVILSRSKPTPDVQQELLTIQKQCRNSITSMECDISVPAHVQKVFTIIRQKFGDYPVRGVFHSAVVLHDGLIETLNISLYEKVFKPKVNGVLNLHHATRHCQLDYFVCYSSISAFLGNTSQTNYAAANSFLDLFCQYRRKLGLAGQSVNWGALNLGLLLNKEHFHRFLEAKGMMVLDVAEIHKSLEQCLMHNRPQQAICRFHFRNIRYNILSQNKALTLRLKTLVEQAFQKSKEADSETKQTDLVSSKDYVFSLLSETISTDQSELSEESLLSSLGLDSMQAMTLQNLIFQERGVNVPLVKLLDPNATLSTVIAELSEAAEGGKVSEDMGDDGVSTRL